MKDKPLALTLRLLRYATRYRKWLLMALVLIVGMSASINYMPILIKRVIDQCLTSTAAPAAERSALLLQLSGLYLGLALFGFLLRYAQGLLTAWIGQRVISDLRMDVFRKILRMHMGHFDRVPVGSLLTRVTSDIERLQGFVTEGVVGTISDLFMLLGIAAYMVFLNLHLSLTLFLVLPPVFILLLLVNKRLRVANRKIRKRQTRLNIFLQENLTGMTTIQLFNRQKHACNDFANKNASLREAYYEEVHWFSLYFPIIEIGLALAYMLVLGMGGYLILNGSALVTIGALIAFLAYVGDFFRPLGSLSDKAGMYQTAMASAERIFELLDNKEEVQDPTAPLSSDLLQGRIAFEHVSFAYNDDNWVLRDLNFNVEPGQAVAVVGATGAGKSTIIQLIGRFYDVQKGAVSINGENVRNFKRDELRQHIGYVFQDPFLFAGSIADNISLLNPELKRDDLVAAAKTVNADPFITALPDGYDTILNERGEGLSLGQKQLLSMARTLAQNPALLFVLDEATASIDTATELLIQDALGKLMEERTSIVIAHRLSTIRHADKILVMREGQLIDAGTHDELMARDGYYRHLYDLLSHSP